VNTKYQITNKVKKAKQCRFEATVCIIRATSVQCCQSSPSGYHSARQIRQQWQAI